MKDSLRFALSALVLAAALFASNAIVAQAQNASVKGDGTPGRIAKWVGPDNPSREVANSVITESDSGLIGVGTSAPSSKLTVAGLIESTLGGYKFPDGTVQTTAGLASVFHDGTLAGNGSAAAPLGIANGGVGTNQLANNAVTAPKIAPGNVVKSLNGLKDDVTLAASSGIKITPAGNTLTIASTAADPEQNAFQKTIFLAVKDGAGSTASLTVPSGKRLVIEYVSFVTDGDGIPDLGFKTTVAGNTANYSIPSGKVDGGIQYGDRLVRIYSDSDVSFFVSSLGTHNTIVSISGHLVDLP